MKQYGRILGFLLFLIPGSLSAETPEPVQQLQSVHAELHQALSERLQQDQASGRPVDLMLSLSSAIGHRSVTLHLHQRRGEWLKSYLTDLPSGLSIESLDPSGLKWNGTRLTGKLVVAFKPTWSNWTGRRGTPLAVFFNPRRSVPGEWVNFHLSSPEEIHETYPVIYELDAEAAKGKSELELTLDRAIGNHTIMLSFEQSENGWVYSRSIRMPARAGLRYIIDPSELSINEQGQLHGEMQVYRIPAKMANADFLKYWAEVKKQGVEAPLKELEATNRVPERFAGTGMGKDVLKFNLQSPRLVVSGTLRDGRFEGTYSRDEVGNERVDRVHGHILAQRLTGTFEAAGRDLNWRGPISGLLQNPPNQLAEQVNAMELKSADLDTQISHAYELYREVMILDMIQQHYPLRWHEASHRLLVPQPDIASMDEAAKRDWLNRVVLFASAARSRRPAATQNQPVIEDSRFGPYLPPQVLPNSTLPAYEASAAQQWVQPSGWEFIGPIAVADEPIGPPLPEVLPSPGSRYHLPGELNIDRSAKSTRRGGWIEAEQINGWLRPPLASGVEAGAATTFAWYAATEVESERGGTYWLAVETHDRGSLWVNGQLAWQSDANHNPHHPAMIQVELKAGMNQFLLRCANEFEEGANARHKQVAYFANFGDPAAHHPRGPLDLTRARLSIAVAGSPRTAEVDVKPRALPARSWRGYRGDGRSIYPEAQPPLVWDLDAGTNIAWQTPLPEGFADPVYWGDRMFVSSEPGGIHVLDARSGKLLWEKQHLDAKRDKEGNIRTSHTATTPVVDADHVWVHYGSGDVYCYTHAGELVWHTQTNREWNDPVIGAPILAGDVLVIQVAGPPRPKGSTQRHNYELIALNAHSGKKRWTASDPRGFGAGQLLVNLQYGNQTRSVIVTAAGQVISAEDGSILHAQIAQIEANGAAPTLEGEDVIFNSPLGVESIRLWLDEAGRVLAKTNFRMRRTSGFGQNAANGRYGKRYWFRSGLQHEGMIYTLRTDTAHVPGHHNLSWLQLDVYDSTHGQHLAQVRPVLRESLDPAAAPMLAGQYLYLLDGGSPVGGYGGEDKFGKLAIVDTRFPPVVIAENNIPKTRATPLAVEDRLYLRTQTGLVCIAITTPKGRNLQERAITQRMFQTIGLPPRPGAVIEATALDPESTPSAIEPWTIRHQSSPNQWLVLGPLKPATGNDPELLKKLCSEIFDAGSTIRVGEQTLEVSKIAPAHLIDGKLDIGAISQRTSGAIVYCSTIIEATRESVIELELSGPTMQAWLNGEPVTKGSLVRLELGMHHLLIRSTLPDNLPPFGRIVAEAVISETVDPIAQREQWLEMVKKYEQELRQIIEQTPGTRWAQLAKNVLEEAAKN